MARKQFGKTWWARRWLDVLEQFGWANRLARGRTYARSGRVLDVNIYPGEVAARVQGRRARPYEVHITIPVLSDAQWERVMDAMAERAVFMAKLLAGEMPQNIEEAFEAAGVHLFPTPLEDLQMSCSCPDWAVPCKHIAATFYVLGEMFDYDPFLLFLLRGRSKEEVIEALEARYTREEGAPPSSTADDSHPTLEESLNTFWGTPEVVRDLTPRPDTSPPPDTMLRRLGEFPQPEVADLVHATMRQVYAVISQKASALLRNDQEPDTPPDEPKSRSVRA